MTWTDAGVTAVVVIVIPLGVYVFQRLNNHGERLVKVETEIGGLGRDVGEIKRETRRQTGMLYQLLGKLGIGIGNDDDAKDDGR